MSHEKTLRTLDRVKRKNLKKKVAMPTMDICRRRFHREHQGAPVSLQFFNAAGELVMTGNGKLHDYSPEGAKVTKVVYDDNPANLPKDGLKVSFRVTEGELKGVEAFGAFARLLPGGATFAVRFDCFFIQVDDE